MTLFDIIPILFLIIAIIGTINARFLRLPATIGQVVFALLASLGLLLIDAILPGLHLAGTARSLVSTIDFREALMEGMLSFLLFAGALHVDLGALASR